MIKTFKILVLLTSALTLISCQLPTKYKKAGETDYGYNSYRLNKDYYKVIFKGNKDTSKEKVETYLLYRIAELTNKNGYKNFIIKEKDIDVDYDAEKRTVYRNTFYRPQNSQRVNSFNSYPYYTNGFTGTVGTKRLSVSKEYEAIAFVKMTNRDTAKNEKGSINNAQNIINILKNDIVEP